MGFTLHEMATKLQEYIVDQQQNAHDYSSLTITKYNNLKLKMSSMIKFPHVIVSIGISEALYNIKDGTKVDGGLGPDDKYVKKWLEINSIVDNLKELYDKMTDLVEAQEDETDTEAVIFQEGEADQLKMDAPKMRRKFARFMSAEEYATEMEEEMDEIIADSSDKIIPNAQPETYFKKASYLESINDIKKDLKKWLKSYHKKNDL